jgi:uncharacterized phage protein (TIGR02220 family)
MTGDIVFECLDTQGLFINICALYWQRNADLSIEDINKRFKNPLQLANLTDRFISVSDNKINIKFLDEQLIEAGHISKTNSINGSKGGRPKAPKIQEEKPTANRTLTDRKAKKSKEEQEQEEEINNVATQKDIDFKKLLEYFNKTTNKNFKTIPDKAKKAFNARIKEGYNKQDIMNAILNCSKDKYHIENPKYLTPEFISRPDKFIMYLNAEVKKESGIDTTNKIIIY